MISETLEQQIHVVLPLMILTVVSLIGCLWTSLRANELIAEMRDASLFRGLETAFDDARNARFAKVERGSAGGAWTPRPVSFASPVTPHGLPRVHSGENGGTEDSGAAERAEEPTPQKTDWN